jgi:hypothetical protein
MIHSSSPRAGAARRFTAVLFAAIAVAASGAPLTAGDTASPQPVKFQKVAANPLYLAWKGQEGKKVTFNRTERISGGAPVPGGGDRAASSTTVQFALAQFSAGQATITVTTSNQPPQTLVIPATLASNDLAFTLTAGSEKLKIGGKTYDCVKYTYSTSSKAELGRDPQGLRGQVTVWVADGVPGGVVKRTISLTIRASYDITDTLAPTP